METRLTLGPLLFNWPAEKRRDFYFRIADEAAVDSVCLGEVVCAKRAPFFDPHLPEVMERLQAAGKEVVHSTLALINNAAEMEGVRALAAEPDFLIEANDLASAALLRGRPHVIGPFVNVYNEGTLGYLARQGAVRACLPVELPAASIAVLARSGLCDIEVMVFGRLPLAISARCYHARAHNLHKDGCRYVCEQDPDGMDVDSLTGQSFLAVNGTQTLSYTVSNLLGDLRSMRDAGVGRFRLSPQDTDMVAVTRLFREVLDGRQEPGVASERLAGLMDGVPFSNGFHHATEGLRMVEDAG
ncbi:MAG: U32 family peptidase [Alphaproteobacteria bacterium]